MTTDNGLALSSPPELPEVEDINDGELNPQGDTSTPSVDDGYIRINKSEIAAEISRLQRDDPAFANVFNSLVGQKAASKYQPRIDELDRELQVERYRQRAAQYENLTPEEVASRSTADRNFALDYAQFRGTPAPVVNDVNTVVQRALSTTFNSALEQGLPQDRVEYYQEQVRSGKYDNDASGQTLDWTESMSALQRDMFGELRRPATPATTPQPNKPAVVDTASPDLTGGRSNANGNRWTLEQVQRMTNEESLQAFPNEGDYERAIRAGRIEGLSPETKDFYGIT